MRRPWWRGAAAQLGRAGRGRRPGGGGFAGLGLEPGSRVAVQLPNGVAWLRATLGALRAGLTVVPINTAYTDPELEYVLADSSASLLVAADRARAGGRRAASAPGRPRPRARRRRSPTTRRAPSFLCYTSGTTGRPRGAMLTAAALRANQEQCLAMEPPVVREDDRVLLVLPLFHVYGLNAGFGLVAATGACAVLLETFDPRRSLAVMAEEHVTAVPGAPPMYQAWLAAADAAGSDADLRRGFAAMRMASSGAAPLPEEVWTAMRERAAVTVWEGYGLTEAAPVVASTLATGRAKPELHRRPAARRRAASCRDTAAAEPAAGRGRPGTDDGPRGARARSWSAGRTCSPATGPTAPTGRTPTAGSAPATSPTATATATCTWSTGAAT